MVVINFLKVLKTCSLFYKQESLFSVKPPFETKLAILCISNFFFSWLDSTH